MEPSPQSTFGRYVLLEPIAEGGMGHVYRAVLRETAGFSKHVALKRILRRFSDSPELKARFADEARIACTLSHSNIVQVFDFGHINDEYYLAMELVDGPDLGHLLAALREAGSSLPLPAALYIAAALCRGLGAAHLRVEEGVIRPVVHRDVSPPNVLISRQGQVKIADFGIAKAAERSARTRSGVLVGKCRYMSPEQAAGKPVDARTDVFAAGILLFEMICNRPLFGGSSPEEVLKQILSGPIEKPSTFVTSLGEDIDQIVLRALARDAEQRYPNGAAMARDLERLLHISAPGYSQDDLSALVASCSLNPAQQALPAQPDALLPTLAATAQPGHTPPLTPVNQLQTAVDHQAQTALFAQPTLPAGPAQAKASANFNDLPRTQPAGYQRPTEPAVVVHGIPSTVSPGRAEPTPTPHLTAHSVTAWERAASSSSTRRTIGIALGIGLVLGAAAGRIRTIPTVSSNPATTASLRSTEHVRIELLGVEQHQQNAAYGASTRLSVLITWRAPTPLAATEVGTRFTLHQGSTSAYKPLFWHAPRPGQWVLVFARRAEQAALATPLRLRFQASPTHVQEFPLRLTAT